MSERNGPAVLAQGVGLRYRLAKQRIPSFKEYAIHWMRGSLAYEDLWALRDVSFRIERGQSVAIVGRNGAGKTTLLKVIAGILAPHEGRVAVSGAVVPVLGLGIGFDYELTGLENIMLTGLLLGHRRREVERKIDDIVEFSGLDDFVRSPIRNYSDGMRARLGFSIATAWTPDILTLDEVLAVGDARFVKRCHERLRGLRAQGVTIVMVSHDGQALRHNCDLGLWLDRGRLRAAGPVDEVIASYEAEGAPA